MKMLLVKDDRSTAAYVESSIVEIQVYRLRAKVDRPFDVPLIRTERGRGYIPDDPPPPERARRR
jgi:DNA-binding response OmpR family regulator